MRIPSFLATVLLGLALSVPSESWATYWNNVPPVRTESKLACVDELDHPGLTRLTKLLLTATTIKMIPVVEAVVFRGLGERAFTSTWGVTIGDESHETGYLLVNTEENGPTQAIIPGITKVAGAVQLVPDDTFKAKDTRNPKYRSFTREQLKSLIVKLVHDWGTPEMLTDGNALGQTKRHLLTQLLGLCVSERPEWLREIYHATGHANSAIPTGSLRQGFREVTVPRILWATDIRLQPTDLTITHSDGQFTFKIDIPRKKYYRRIVYRDSRVQGSMKEFTERGIKTAYNEAELRYLVLQMLHYWERPEVLATGNTFQKQRGELLSQILGLYASGNRTRVNEVYRAAGHDPPEPSFDL